MNQLYFLLVKIPFSILENRIKCRRFPNGQLKKNYSQVSMEMDKRGKGDLIARSIKKKICSSKEINVIGAQTEEVSRVLGKSLVIKI